MDPLVHHPSSAAPLADPQLDAGVRLVHAGIPFRLRARTVPRYLWSTASIDVYVDGVPVLVTGGRSGMTGSVSSQFSWEGRAHNLELHWGAYASRGFPVRLVVDGEPTEERVVPVQGQAKGCVAILVVPPLVTAVIAAAMLLAGGP
ncbi:MAG: hypothetical protein HY904_19550 [Deltaproteobacteria bacterium]|nr:hypothetical protein [Deltaproteobacteria bacterium]